ncbi:MFS transporter [Allobranchiibius huperziae]|uniref:Putative MFS family arabinose efflux permease n=1 Tax=Allobranchiibius huperziae TaxID=1874116 RepID=A0A853DEV4_9MICO|nr:MFS transporter [Allobranchiibius huperziae]NYJ75207.1 putative MFS family arabinose efflux permease [Allobranchiibius huperziae]
MAQTTAPAPAGYRRGDAGYRRITLSLFAAGMTTFVAMYAAQAVLPALSDAFDVSPAGSALAVSATTGMLALAIIPASALSERFGRTRVMVTSALLTAAVGIVLPWVGSFGLLVALRGVQGIALAGVPATAMAYLAEEVHAQDLGAAMGRYIAGTTVGGLAGRVVASLTLDLSTWRWALEVAALVSLAFTLVFVRFAPPSVYFRPQPIGVRRTARAVAGHLRSPRLLALFGTAFLLMGGFVSIYNLLGYRLLARPFSLSQTVVGLVFLMYLSGTVSSAAAGRLSDRFGRAAVLLTSEVVALIGLLLTWVTALPLVLIGVLLFTAGFFAAHAVASGWVSRIAHDHRAEASSLYLFAYYAGSSVLGAAAGLAYSAYGWSGAVAYVGVIFLLALTVVGWLRHGVREPA